MPEPQQAPGGVGLLILDMINALDFGGGTDLRPAAEAAGAAILKLRAAADAAGVPVVYVNDNNGAWHSERTRIVGDVIDSDTPGAALTRRLAPRDDDYFVIKPQFSGFYASNLPVLLPQLGVSRLVLTGIAADICVLFTAADAHMRQYDLWVPADAVAAGDPQRRDWALDIMAHSMAADTRPTGELTLPDWIAGTGAARPG